MLYCVHFELVYSVHFYAYNYSTVYSFSFFIILCIPPFSECAIVSLCLPICFDLKNLYVCQLIFYISFLYVCIYSVKYSLSSLFHVYVPLSTSYAEKPWKLRTNPSYYHSLTTADIVCDKCSGTLPNYARKPAFGSYKNYCRSCWRNTSRKVV